MSDGVTEADLAPLVLAARGGDEEAFRLLYRAVQPGLLRYLRGLAGEDAEDLASEAWLQIARDLPSFRDQGAGFRGWAATIARHRALDHLRRHRRRPAVTVPDEVLIDLPDREDTEDRAIEAASTRAAIALIGTLPRDQAEAVLLRAVVGLDAKATAAVMGKRPGAVRTAAWRGLRRLAEQLEERARRDAAAPSPAAPSVAAPPVAAPAAPPAAARRVAEAIAASRRVTKTTGATPEGTR